MMRLLHSQAIFLLISHTLNSILFSPEVSASSCSDINGSFIVDGKTTTCISIAKDGELDYSNMCDIPLVQELCSSTCDTCLNNWVSRRRLADPCQDFSGEFTIGDSTQTCELVEEFSMWLCVSNTQTKELCPKTCKQCKESTCRDTSEDFTIGSKTTNCQSIQDSEIYRCTGPAAERVQELCPLTCDSCPQPEPKCNDSTEEFLVGSKTRTCEMVRNSVNLWMCNSEKTKQLCPNACEACPGECYDSREEFEAGGEMRTCEMISESFGWMCGSIPNVPKECPKTCFACPSYMPSVPPTGDPTPSTSTIEPSPPSSSFTPSEYPSINRDTDVPSSAPSDTPSDTPSLVPSETCFDQRGEVYNGKRCRDFEDNPWHCNNIKKVQDRCRVTCGLCPSDFPSSTPSISCEDVTGRFRYKGERVRCIDVVNSYRCKNSDVIRENCPETCGKIGYPICFTDEPTPAPTCQDVRKAFPYGSKDKARCSDFKPSKNPWHCNNVAKIQNKCPRTCDLCESEPPSMQPSDECFDTVGRFTLNGKRVTCGDVANQYKCRSNEIVQNKCPKTCKTCVKEEPTLTPTKKPTKAPVVSECADVTGTFKWGNDFMSTCDDFKTNPWHCNNVITVVENCPVTCDRCPEVPTPNPTVGCDVKDFEGEFLLGGEATTCEDAANNFKCTNSEKVRRRCPKSCGICETEAPVNTPSVAPSIARITPTQTPVESPVNEDCVDKKPSFIWGKNETESKCEDFTAELWQCTRNTKVRRRCPVTCNACETVLVDIEV